MGLKPAGGWLRVSTSAQDEQLQRGDIRRFAAEHGLDVAVWYKAHAKSASKGEQDADMSDALEDTRSGRIRVLIATALDRTERRGIEAQFRVIREFREAGGDIWSVLESPVNGKPLEEVGLTLATIADMNRRKAQLAAFNTKRGHDEIDANGAFRGRVPFGYEAVGPKYHKRLVPTEIGRDWVPKIFARIIAGWSLGEVCWWLDTLKIRFRKDGTLAPWWPATVGQLIRNPVYIGHYSTDDGRWVHECEALVDATIFRTANEKLTARVRKQVGPRGRPEYRARLRGALKCPECGGSMGKNASPNTRTSGGAISKPYYRCRGTGGPMQKGCGNNVALELVDAAVDRVIRADFHEPVLLRVLVKGADHQPEIDQVDLELRQLPARGLGRAAEQAERERLWAEQDRLEDLPVEEDHWEEVPTGEMYDQVWAGLPEPERGAWLVRHGFRVYASKAGVRVTFRDRDLRSQLRA
jgi:DNA invertase Pin-like site-specific DNA recombinase